MQQSSNSEAPFSVDEACLHIVHFYIKGEGRKYLDEVTAAAIHHATWALQDGYGKPGFTPPQGWDWSGIRDSTDSAIRKMAAVILQLTS